MMNGLELIFPTKKHEQSAKEYQKEHLSAGETTLPGGSGLHKAESYDAWLEKIDRDLHSEIRSVIFFAIRKADKRLVGVVNVRYPYEGYVRQHGHIGYGVRPSERRKGYATAMLKMTLAYCKMAGLRNVLLTCDKSNHASAKTILNCAGVFEREDAQDDGRMMQRYWITL